MRGYFRGTASGRLRARTIVPEPLFVHSDLTTLVQVADLVAYVIVFGIRLPGMIREKRDELAELGRAILDLQHFYYRESKGKRYRICSLKVINDLRSRRETKRVAAEVRAPEKVE